MSGLLSMLVPLETLPGWPPAPNPSVAQFLGLLVLVPLVLALVISGASYLATTRALKRFGPPVNPATAYAVPAAIEAPAADASAAIVASAGAGAGGAGSGGAGSGGAGTGGTSARW